MSWNEATVNQIADAATADPHAWLANCENKMQLEREIQRFFSYDFKIIHAEEAPAGIEKLVMQRLLDWLDQEMHDTDADDLVVAYHRR